MPQSAGPGRPAVFSASWRMLVKNRGRPHRLLAAAEDERVARLEGERKRLDGHVGARFEDHVDHAERGTHPARAQAVRQPSLVDELADGIALRAHGREPGAQLAEPGRG